MIGRFDFLENEGTKVIDTTTVEFFVGGLIERIETLESDMKILRKSTKLVLTTISKLRKEIS